MTATRQTEDYYKIKSLQSSPLFDIPGLNTTLLCGNEMLGMILIIRKTQKPVVETLQHHPQYHQLPTPVISCVNSEGRAVRKLVATLKILARNTQSVVAFRDAYGQGRWKTRCHCRAIYYDDGPASQLVLGFQLLNRCRMFDLKRSLIYIYIGKD